MLLPGMQNLTLGLGQEMAHAGADLGGGHAPRQIAAELLLHLFGIVVMNGVGGMVGMHDRLHIIARRMTDEPQQLGSPKSGQPVAVMRQGGIIGDM